MFSLIIGLTVGVVMGLTGAGGALIAIPLFVHFYSLSIKEATTYSLITVFVSTFIFILENKKKAYQKTAVLFWLSGAFSGYFVTELKKQISEFFIVILLSIVISISLYYLWKPRNSVISNEKSHETPIKTIFIGMILGALTSLTGLGGGVLIIPILMRFYKKDYEQSLSISLLTILLISSTAIIFQWQTASHFVFSIEIVYLIIGTILAYLIIKLLKKSLKDQTILLVRKIVFTLVCIYALITVFSKVI